MSLTVRNAIAQAYEPVDKSLLSSREIEVLKHVSQGMSNKQIGRVLRISDKTVRNHLSNTFDKLHAVNRTDAVMIAMRVGQLVL